MSQDKKVVETKLSLSEEKNLGFLESIAKRNTEKITREILEGLSEDTGDSDSYDVESVAKTPKIDLGDQVIQFSKNQLLNRVISTI
jgi:chromosome condensin MukBEF complex kleisin-like MukF subunit